SKSLRFYEIRRLLDTGSRIRAHVGDGDSMDTRDEAKLADIDAQRRILDLMLKQASCKVACCESVGLCNLSEVIHCSETAASTHVLHRDGGLSWNMLAYAFGEDSPFDVRGATGREVDDEVQSLALIKRRLFCSEHSGTYCYEQAEGNSEE